MAYRSITTSYPQRHDVVIEKKYEQLLIFKSDLKTPTYSNDYFMQVRPKGSFKNHVLVIPVKLKRFNQMLSILLNFLQKKK